MERLETVLEFEEQIKSGVTVFYFASLLQVSKRKVLPVFRELAEKYTNFSFFRIDPRYGNDVFEKNGIELVPAFKIFKDGKELQWLRGPDTGALKRALEEL